ncbi:MAG: sulfur carrier protein ThiS adenylyltransferase ThiF [Anaerovoracaceae bacterium]
MAENQVTSGSRPCACESGSIPSEKEMNRALADRCGEKIADAFGRATVAICGLGGLGSNIAVSLIRAGVGTLILIDFDKVDITNLNRQQYKAFQVGMDKTEALAANLAEINPYTRLLTHQVRITENNAAMLLEAADMICEAFDDPVQKSMLVNTVLEKLPSKYLIAASGMAGIASANDIKTRRISERFYLCGDGVSDSAEKPGLLSARVALCAAHQAHMVLRLLAGFKEP